MQAQSKDGKLFHVGRFEGWASFWLRPGVGLWVWTVLSLWVIRFLASMGENGGGNITDCLYCQHAVFGLTWGPKNIVGGKIWQHEEQEDRSWGSKGKPVYSCAVLLSKVGRSSWSLGGRYHAVLLFCQLRERFLSAHISGPDPSPHNLFWGNGKWKWFQEMKDEK